LKRKCNGQFGPQGVTKCEYEIVNTFEFFFNKEGGTDGVSGLFMLISIIQKHTLKFYFNTEMVISMPGFGVLATETSLN
jgi:hypothetical protein